MRRVAMAGVISWCVLGASVAAAATLPLERVRLYETGIGYFERKGTLGKREARVSLPVNAGQLDDVLKTLVVMSKDGKASVTSIELESRVSREMARSLAGLPPGSGDALRLAAMLKSLKGAAVAVHTDVGLIDGRVVDVVEPSADEPVESCSDVRLASLEGTASAGAAQGATRVCATRRLGRVLVMKDDGELSEVSLDGVKSVRPRDPAHRARLAAALDALGEGATRARRDVTVRGTPGAEVTLGYVTEAPLWRASYRVVLDAGKPAGRLMGWALVHNDTDEDWKGVRVELVNGQPDSFLFPLAAPRYAYRELVTPTRDLPTVPQLRAETPDEMWQTGGLGLSGYGEGGGGRGEGIGLGSIGTVGHGAGAAQLGAGESSLLSVGNLAQVSGAERVEEGALFRYELADDVELRAHGSALLPFYDEAIVIERVAYFDSVGVSARSALFFEHGGKATLPEGTIAVFEGGGFAGESVLLRTKPGESRVVRFGNDLDVELSRAASTSEEATRAFAFRRGRLEEHYLRDTHETFSLSNKSAVKRRLYLGLSYVNNAAVTGADELAHDDESGRTMAVFAIDGRSEKEQVLAVKEGLVRFHVPSLLAAKKLAAWSELAALASTQRATLASAAQAMGRSEASYQAAMKARGELDERLGDQARLRDDARATVNAKGVAANEWVARLLAGEDEVRKLRSQAKELDARGDEERQRAVRVLATLAPSG